MTATRTSGVWPVRAAELPLGRAQRLVSTDAAAELYGVVLD
jgi:hypothetical protein